MYTSNIGANVKIGEKYVYLVNVSENVSHNNNIR